MKEGYDILAVGDVVTDAFIELLPHEAEIDQSTSRDHHPLLCMVYGTKIPFEDTVIIPAVGNSANAAVASARLGLRTSFYSNIGDDRTGRDIVRALHSGGIATDLVRVHDGKKSNYHYVLWYEADRTILIKHESYDYTWPHIAGHSLPRWLYLSSMAESATPVYAEIARFLEHNKDIKLAFQPGTFQMKLGADKLAKLYARSEVLACNVEEAQLISGKTSRDIAVLAQTLRKLGPKIVVITDGPRGSYVYDGAAMWFMPIYPDPAPPYERTGAGDAYTSTFVAALADGQDIPTAMAWGSINSMSVVQKVGAQAGLLTKKEILDLLGKAPKHFQVKSMEAK